VIIRESLQRWSPAEVLFDLEWWELLGIWGAIVKRNEAVNGSYEKHNKKVKPVNKSPRGGNIEYVLIDKWRRPAEISDKAKMMRDRILRGEL
jgi:hypothetical protein